VLEVEKSPMQNPVGGISDFFHRPFGVFPKARCAIKYCTCTVISTLTYTVLRTGAQELFASLVYRPLSTNSLH
jgi:hypothetical protein